MQRTIQSHRSSMVNRNNSPQFARINNFLDLHEIRMVPKHMAHSNKYTFAFGTCSYIITLLKSLCNRFL